MNLSKLIEELGYIEERRVVDGNENLTKTIYSYHKEHNSIVLHPIKKGNMEFYIMEVFSYKVLKYKIPVHNPEDLSFYTKNIYRFII